MSSLQLQRKVYGILTTPGLRMCGKEEVGYRNASISMLLGVW